MCSAKEIIMSQPDWQELICSFCWSPDFACCCDEIRGIDQAVIGQDAGRLSGITTADLVESSKAIPFPDNIYAGKYSSLLSLDRSSSDSSNEVDISTLGMSPMQIELLPRDKSVRAEVSQGAVLAA